MAITVLLGTPTEQISAATIRRLVAPDGSKPCAEGLRAGLRWIGTRTLSLTDAINEARDNALVSDYVDWALRAIDYGDGSGDGSGYGSGYGDGSGYGSGYGSEDA